MILLAGIVVLGVIAVGLMTLYAALCWSYYRDLQRQTEAAEALQERTDGPEEIADIDTESITVKRVPGHCDRCGSPSVSGRCDDCRENAGLFP